MLVSTKLTLWSNSDQVSESWEVQWKYYWGDVVWSGDVIWIREYKTQHCAFGCKKFVLFDILHPFAMQGMRGGMEEVIQCIRGFYKCHLMTKTSVHVWMHRIGRQNWKVYCVWRGLSERWRGGGRDTATLKLLFGLYVLAFSAGVIGGNTKCSKYFLTRCILIFFGETNWDLCIP